MNVEFTSALEFTFSSYPTQSSVYKGDTFYAISQLCGCCGYKNTDALTVPDPFYAIDASFLFAVLGLKFWCKYPIYFSISDIDMVCMQALLKNETNWLKSVRYAFSVFLSSLF